MASTKRRPGRLAGNMTALGMAAVLSCVGLAYVLFDHLRDDLVREALRIVATKAVVAESSGLYHTFVDTPAAPVEGMALVSSDLRFSPLELDLVAPDPAAGEALGLSRQSIEPLLEGQADGATGQFLAEAQVSDGRTRLTVALPFTRTGSCLACHAPGAAAAGIPEDVDWVSGQDGKAVGLLVARSALEGPFLRPSDLVELASVTLAVASLFLLGALLRRQRRLNAEALVRTRESEREVEHLRQLAEAQRGIQDREARLRAIVQNIGEALITYDGLGRIESVNPAACRVFTRPPEVLLGSAIEALFSDPTTGVPLSFQLFPTLAPDSGASETMESFALRADGTRIPVDLAVTTMRLDARRLHVAIVRDISKRKEAEAQLGEAQERLRDAIEALPDAFVLYDADDRLVICNQRYRDLYAMTSDAIRPGKRFEDMLRYGIARGQYADAHEDPEGWVAERLRLHRNPPDRPIEQHLGDGRWLRVFERRMPDGQTVGFRIDITELKQREEELRRSEGQLRAVVRGALDAIVVADRAGRIREFNPAAEQVFGFTRAEATERPARDLLVPRRHRELYDARMRSILEATRETEVAQRVEARALRKDGTEILMEIAFNRVQGEDGPVVLAFMRDITEERAKTLALEDARVRAEEADRAKSDFLAMMSHEIRTPLNAVIGLLDLMMHTPLDDTQRSHIDTARQSALALLQILNDILDFSRLEARRLEFVDTPFDPRALVEAVRALFSVRAQEKGIALTVSVAPDVPEALVGDAGRIRQVLINLVANAVKFTEAGGVVVTLSGRASTARAPASRARLRFAVEDSGVGIAPSHAEAIFSRFTTSGKGKYGRTEGVGLGLAISRELVEGMGGEIAYAPRAGGGSRFRVDLDLPAVDPARLAESSAGEEGPDPGLLRGARILLAEDNATNQMMTGVLLERWGCTYEIAQTGAEVLARLEQDRFDAILMDVSMPDLDGFEASRQIRESEGPQADVPIVALTAHAQVAERDKAFAVGMNAFVTKPIDAAALKAALGDVLRARAHALPPASRREDADAIDATRLAQVSDDLPADLRDAIFTRCLTDLEDQAARLEGADAAATVEAAAHVLVSLAATFGATAVSEAAEALERRARADTAEFAALAVEARALAGHVRAAARRIAAWHRASDAAE